MQCNISIRSVDYLNPADQTDLVNLLDMYARDEMGGGEALSEDVKARLCADLAEHPGAMSLIASINHQSVGLLNAFVGYSTFKARPLLNIHDIAVHPDFRGRGVGQALLAALEEYATAMNCCKLTLEVLSGNHVAKKSYERFGFKQYELAEATGQAIFLQKWL